MTITAWRCWRTTRREEHDHWRGNQWRELPPNLMYSIFVPFVWDSPTARAVVEDLSDSSQWCLEYGGLHSLKKEFLHPVFLGNTVTIDFVIGQVEITGRAIEHEGGWRSEKQTVVELHVPEAKYVEPYRELFQCDVYVLDDIWDFFIHDEIALKLRRKQLVDEGFNPQMLTHELPLWTKQGYCEYR